MQRLEGPGIIVATGSRVQGGFRIVAVSLSWWWRWPRLWLLLQLLLLVLLLLRSRSYVVGCPGCCFGRIESRHGGLDGSLGSRAVAVCC